MSIRKDPFQKDPRRSDEKITEAVRSAVDHVCVAVIDVAGVYLAGVGTDC